MSTSDDYEKVIAQYSRTKLRRLWRLIEEGQTSKDGWPPGKAFEYLILRAFQLDGAEVRWPYNIEIADNVIEQIDGAVYIDGLACLIECKDWEGKINIEPMAKLRNQLLRRPSQTTGVVFSRFGFTDPALTLAKFTLPQTILLWTGEEISFAIERKYMCNGLLAKYRRCIEEGIPDYNIRVEEPL